MVRSVAAVVIAALCLGIPAGARLALGETRPVFANEVRDWCDPDPVIATDCDAARYVPMPDGSLHVVFNMDDSGTLSDDRCTSALTRIPDDAAGWAYVLVFEDNGTNRRIDRRLVLPLAALRSPQTRNPGVAVCELVVLPSAS